MRGHQAEQPSALQERRPVRRKQAAPAPSAGMTPAGLLALQRTVGNAAVAGLLRGSGEHERSRADQRSGGAGSMDNAPLSAPSNRFERAAGIDARAVQRVETGAEPESAQSGGPEAAGKSAKKGNVRERELELSKKYGIRIGPPEGAEKGHFSHAVLDRIDIALAGLPQADLGPNEKLIAIEPDPSGKNASAYDPDEQTIGIVHPIIAGGIRAPGWLYARLNRGSGWQRKRMDRGAMSGMEGIGSKSDRAVGIGKGQRHVMAGVSDELAHGNLVEWTVRHEVGHSVDEMVEWNQGLAEQEHFGGWRIHGGDEAGVVARAILQKAGFLGVLPETQESIAVSTLSVRISSEGARKDAADDAGRLHTYFGRFKDHLEPSEFTRGRELAMRFVRLALAQPWSLDNGGADVLDVGGRTYHVDQHDKWVSYSTEQRSRHALSNYQFSNPQEWFAEAYAAYYDPKSGVGDRLSPEVRAWFTARDRTRGPE